MHDQFKVAISGTGTIGKIHAEALKRIDAARLVAVAEPRIDAGCAFAAEYGAAHYPSLDELLEGADIDVVIVTTPSGLHPDQVVLAANAGKHVITEKPMGITKDGLDRMIDACRENSVQLAVIFQNRCFPDVLKTKRAIEQGFFGRMVMGNGAMYWHRTDAYYAENGGWRGTWALDGGGALMNQAIHTIDQLQWLMGGIELIAGNTATLSHDIETEDNATASFRYSNGAVGTIVATTSAAKDYPIRLEFVGTEGRVTLENNLVTLWECDRSIDEAELTEFDRKLIAGWSPQDEWGDSHMRQLALMFEAFASGTEPFVAGTEARKAVDIILGIYQSSQTQSHVTPTSHT